MIGHGPAIGQFGPVIGQYGPVIGQFGPVIGQSGPAFGQSGPVFGQFGPVIGQWTCDWTGDLRLDKGHLNWNCAEEGRGNDVCMTRRLAEIPTLNSLEAT